VVISGRRREADDAAATALRGEYPGAAVHGFACDTGSASQVQSLWDAARESLGGVDHWINNAGIGQPMVPIWEVEPQLMEAVLRTNVLGVLHGARAAVRGMIDQGSGAVWFVEGHGSNGRIMKGLSVYGTSKRALRYVARALAVETRGMGVLIGALSPGIMITDFTMKQVDRRDPQAWERTRKVFNILGDTPQTVAAFLVPRILAARKTGALIEWLTRGKIFWRFLTAGIARRRLIPE
jgi:NAD(P)-dependent dehydrogenase (short-subunit alcohol dehydrogenase family)